MPNDSEKHNEIESEVYDEFLSTELTEDQDHKHELNDFLVVICCVKYNILIRLSHNYISRF